MQKIKTGLLLVCLLPGMLLVQAQSWEDSLDVELHGFIKTDYVFDTRQVVEAREGLFLLYPKDNMNPVHDNYSYNQYALTSRLKTSVRGPEILNARSSARVEADFSGVTNADIDGFRLRHAYFRLDWEKTSLLFGQYWHPITVPEAFPKPLSLNTGAPFHAFSRHPQLRISHQWKRLKLIGVVSTQRDYSNDGPLGYTPSYMIKGGIPNFHAQAHLCLGNITLGAGGEYKAVAPALEYQGIKKRLPALAGVAFAKLGSNRSRLILEYVYGENLYDQLMMGGYILDEHISSNDIKMKNQPTSTIWADYSYQFHSGWKPGVFLGYAQNQFRDPGANNIDYYLRGSGIDDLYRISPRIIKQIKNLMIGVEAEYTLAYYEKHPRPEAENLRLSLIMLYHF